MADSVHGTDIRAVVTAFGDPESRYLQDGTLISGVGGWMRFEIVSDPTMAEQITKGTRMLVEGKLTVRHWTAPTGETRHYFDVKDARVTILDENGRPKEGAPEPLDDIPYTADEDDENPPF